MDERREPQVCAGERRQSPPLVPSLVVIQVWEEHVLLNSFGQGRHCLVVFWNDLPKQQVARLEIFPSAKTDSSDIDTYDVDTSLATLVEFGQSPFWRTKPRPPLCTPPHWRLLSAGDPWPRGSWVETPPHRGSLNGNCWPSAGSGSAWPPPAAKGVGEGRKREEQKTKEGEINTN